MDFDKLSDFEINKAIAGIVCHAWNHAPFAIDRDPVNRSGVIVSNAGGYYALDFVNNWEYCGQLMDLGNIGIMNISGTNVWMAFHDSRFDTVCMSPDGADNGASVFSCKNEVHHTKPKRAVCECFLMMKQP